MLLEDEDPLDFLDSVEQTSEERLETAKQRINDIADNISASSSKLFNTEASQQPSSSTSTADPDTQRQQLEQLSKVHLKAQAECLPVHYLKQALVCLLRGQLFYLRNC